MRVTDTMMINSYLADFNKTKTRLEELRVQAATQKKILQPSDDPGGTTKILRLTNQIGQVETYKNNIENSLAYLGETTFALENIQTQVTNVLTKLTELKNPSQTQNYSTYADQIDIALSAILDAANGEFDGKYLFGGTDHSDSPYGLTADGKAIEVKAGDVSGVQKAKISSNTVQKINMTGLEIFGTIVTERGNLDSSSSIGDAENSSTSIYDSAGNTYSLNVTYTKTAANTYSFTYDIVDSEGSSVYASAPAAKELVFDSTSGLLKTVDGASPKQFRINVPSEGIDFNYDFTTVEEKNSAASLSHSANQKMDIFNILVQIRDGLKNGQEPSEELEDMISDYNEYILDKSAQAGNLMNQLSDSKDMMDNQLLTLEDLRSKENDVDEAQAILDIQNQEYMLELSYKLSSMVLPKSLLEYL